ncbi:MAG: hypothetical protein M3010_11220, partial [Candidatus Dormibacteraeota bacterium]|nr:hypothetical protein [Candidatus Dormibacteraeota bacterium]
MAKAKSSRRTTTAARAKPAKPARAAAKKPAAAKKAPARDIEALARRAIKEGLGSESYKALVALAGTNLRAMVADPVTYGFEMSGTDSHIALLCKGSASQKLV